MVAKHLAFVSSIPFDWGGSEELWAASAAHLLERGYRVSIFKDRKRGPHPRLRSLMDQGAKWETPRGYELPRSRRVLNRLLPGRSRFDGISYHARRLVELQPDLVVISQGWNADGLVWATACRHAGIPYALISHQANLRGWPGDNEIEPVSAMHLNAVGSFYVAQRLWERTEEMIGQRIPRGEIVRNPYNVDVAEGLPWPSMQDGLRLACVGRFEFKDKGQDLLVRVMGRERWRDRPISVSFYGAGINEEGLRRLISFCRADGCRIVGHEPDVASIWQKHHGLILPSREEGLPLVVVEAMLCGRPSIVTNIVGNAELLDDGQTGFVCPAPNADLIDETLERAWSERARWEAMGVAAATAVRSRVPRYPGRVFADRLESFLD